MLLPMKRACAVVVPVVLLSVAVVAAQRSAATNLLQIYVVDTEGGKAALFVSPSGQTALVDSGNPGGRDTDRIMAAIADAGVKQIDFLISTHYHIDHIGGLQELAQRIPIKHYLDHGPTVEPQEQVQGFQQAYAELYRKAQHTVVKPGDRVPIAGLDWRIVAAAGKVLKAPLPGGGAANAACAGYTPKENSATDENSQSVGSVIALGRFRAIDLGDLLWNYEHDLICPNNPLGTVDLYLVTHHGLDISGSPALVHAVRPRVAVMQNGTRKGAGPQAMMTMRTSPGLEDIWQLHWSYTAGVEQNSAGVFDANVEEPAALAAALTAPPGRGGRGGAAGAHAPAYWIKVTARPDGSFTVSNSRNDFTKTYAPRSQVLQSADRPRS
jgi:beta-lactamase superfamily II metal-dependent hydrolase